MMVRPGNKVNLLLIEDEPAFSLVLKTVLEGCSQAEFHVVVVRRISEAYERIAENQFDIILTDLNLPDSKGIGSFEKIRKQATSSPIVVISSHESEDVAMKTIEIGADDYLFKSQLTKDSLPFRLLKIIYRHQRESVSTKKVAPYSNSKKIFKDPPLELDFLKQSARIQSEKNFNPLDLTSTEFKILACLVINSGVHFTRRRLIQEVWGKSAEGVGDRAVDRHIACIRKKSDYLSSQIRSVYRLGYCFKSPN